MYILEAQQYIAKENAFKHIGYMDKIFSSKKKARAYRRTYHHITTSLRYIVRQYDGEHLQIPAFEDWSDYLDTMLLTIGLTQRYLIDKSKYKMKPTCIESGRHLLALQTSLQQDQSGFMHNMPTIIEAFAENNLYGMQLYDEHFEQPTYIKKYHSGLGYEYNTIAAFAIVDKNKALSALWVHSAFRNQGMGRAFVEGLHVKKAFFMLPESRGFWEKVGISEE